MFYNFISWSMQEYLRAELYIYKKNKNAEAWQCPLVKA